MTGIPPQYAAVASRASEAVEKAADSWTQGVRRLTDLFPTVPQVDLVPAVERYFDLVQRAVDINRDITVRWAQAAGTLTGVVREQAESAAGVLRERGEAAGEAVRERAESFDQAAARFAPGFSPLEYRVHLDKGVLYAKLGQRQQAISALETYMSMTPHPKERQQASYLIEQIKNALD